MNGTSLSKAAQLGGVFQWQMPALNFTQKMAWNGTSTPGDEGKFKTNSDNKVLETLDL